jgi:hypothetical protein
MAVFGHLFFLFFVFSVPSYAIAQTTVNQSPAPSAQGAAPGRVCNLQVYFLLQTRLIDGAPAKRAATIIAS